MNATRRGILVGAAAHVATPRATRAQTKPAIRIGMLQDASGPYAHLGGALARECARQAMMEIPESAPFTVELMSADHRNSPDLGMSIARQWLNDGVDALMEFNNSAIALAVNKLVRDNDRVTLANNVGAAVLSGRECTPNMTHWTFDTAMLGRVLGNAMVDQGADTWFFIRADYVFGKDLRDDTAAVVQARGGKVLDEAALPVGTTDYASALLQAQSSGAKMVALALAGSDLLNCVKQAGEFGLMRGPQRVGSLVIYPQNVRALGLQITQGMYLTESFYWNLNDRTRAFTARVTPRTQGMVPHMGAGGAYSCVRHYLKAVTALGATAAKTSGREAIAAMKRIPVEDDILTNASIRSDVRERNKVMLANNVGSAALSGAACTPNMTHWVFDTAMLARTLGTALYDQGGSTWFFIRADYVFGKALRDDTATVVEKKGGKILGEVAVPLGTTDFASALLAAQPSGAKVVALALAGQDLLNCIKQAGEMGVTHGGQTVGALILYVQDVKSLGLAAAQGLQMSESFYWDLSDRSRAFTKRITPRTGGKPPNMGQAGAYSATLHYLKAVATLGAAAAKASGAATVAKMKELRIDDDVLTNASIRADGRVVSDVHLFEVKKPTESTSEWDLYRKRLTLGPDQAWRPMSEGGCPLLKI